MPFRHLFYILVKHSWEVPVSLCVDYRGSLDSDTHSDKEESRFCMINITELNPTLSEIRKPAA